MLLDDCYIAYINLAHRKDRREHMEKELARVGIKAERFEAISTKGPEWNRHPYRVMFNRTRGAIGCALSQMAVMEKAYEFGRSCVVLEDDLIFATDCLKRFEYIDNFIKTKEPDYDIIFLGGTVHSPAWWHKPGHDPMLQMCKCSLGKDIERIDDERMVRVFGMFSTHAYAVRYGAIPKIISLLHEVMPFTIGIDFSLILHQPNLRCFAFMPGTVKQYNAVSDIGHGITYFENFSKLNGSIENSAYWWQDRMENFNPNTFQWK
jgi:hypothetical protein